MEVPNTSNEVNNENKENKEINKTEESKQDTHSQDGPDNFDLSKRCVLENFTRCSESHLWKLMMSFYDRKGVDSWAKGIVPYFITCNAFIGRSYAQVLMGFIHDCSQPNSPIVLDPTEPLYILELGTGSGKFSFYMLKAILEMKAICSFPIDKIKYVMTDFTENNFQYWIEQENLRPYFESGHLDAAIFNAVSDDHLKLFKSGVTLSPGSCKNPICIIANYLFDTLYHDAFQVINHKLHEGLVSVGSRNDTEPDPLDPSIITRFANLWKYNPVSTDYYQNEESDEVHFQRILACYEGANWDDGASILIPIGALRALRRLIALSTGKALLLSGDKGYSNPEQFVGLSDPHIAVHGSFSVMVNYHAIGMYCTSKGGFALHNPQEEASLKVGAFVFVGDDSKSTNEQATWTGNVFNNLDIQRSQSFPFLLSQFNLNMSSFGPNDFFVLQKALIEDGKPTLESIVSLLKLSDWDSDVFYKFRDLILEQLSNNSSKLQTDLCRGLQKVWENYYFLDSDKDIAFEIGRCYYGVQQYETALRYYQISNDKIGEHHVTFHNMGLCFYHLNQSKEAESFFEKSLNLKSDYQKARSWLDRVKNEMNPPVLESNQIEINDSNVNNVTTKENQQENNNQ